MKILGIDLGTSNTYIYAAEEYPTAGANFTVPPKPLILPKISDDSGSIASVVMYENDRPALAGNIAEREFNSNVRDRGRRFLASQFKPEIATGDARALRYMTDFLTILRQNLPLGTIEEDTRIYGGIPSLARMDFSVNLNACFEAAGWPSPVFVRESDAALVSCLQSGVLDIDDIERKCLILDFGGGTCDYTTVENMNALQNGGDILYGGRLFDDLIYQVFCEKDADFASQIVSSPYEWYVHWIECKREKENFSEFLRGVPAGKDPAASAFTLHVSWYSADGRRHDSFVRDYARDSFVRNAENFLASPQLLAVLADYASRGGLSREARDMLDGRRIGLVSWLDSILANVHDPGSVAKIVLTGGSSRWPFVKEIAERAFPSASCVHSRRGYEDIAFGLAMFPILLESRDRTRALLDEKLPDITGKAVALAAGLSQKQTAATVRMCVERIVNRDIMPTLELASKKGMTIGELENAFLENIRNDSGLMEIVEENSKNLQKETGEQLNFIFSAWLRDNGVLLTPRFNFPAHAIGRDFFDNISVKISRLDFLNIMRVALTKVLPLMVGTATAGAIVAGEPVSAVASGVLAMGATWLAARAAPELLARRKLPAFLLTEANRRKIVENNKKYIERALTAAMKEVQDKMEQDIEKRLKNVLHGMVGKLGVLNQVQTQ